MLLKEMVRNVSFFEKLNEETYYWLGMLFADGSGINWNRISLKSKDPVFLQQFADYVKKPVKQTKGARSVVYAVDFSDKDIRKRLELLGYTRCAKTARPIPLMPICMMRHFLRGYFDGDGSVHKDHRKLNCWRLEIATHSVTTEAIKDILRVACPKANIRTYPRSTSERLMIYNAEGVQQILEFLYKGALVTPHQKADKVKSLIGATL